MTSEQKVLWSVVVVAGLVVGGLMLSSGVEHQLAPEPVAAWVALQPEGSEVARTGRVEIPAGTEFKLHAVMEAKDWSGKTVYFTEAERVVLDGREIPSDLLRRWNRGESPRILWFTVEGFSPFLALDQAEALQEFNFREVFRSDWPRAWTVPGDLQPSAERQEVREFVTGLPRFGTQRFHVRIELFGPKSSITPEVRLRSPEAADLPERVDDFPTAIASLPGGLEVPSQVFGLSQIELPPEARGDVAELLADWTRNRLAFSRLTVIREMLDRANLAYEDLDWVEVDLETGPEWGPGSVEPGDFLRVGERIAILVADRGEPNVLDRRDLCFDFIKGARVRPLDEIFVGEGLVDWARQAPAAIEKPTTGGDRGTR
jgi:hypothetical protein